MCILWMERLNPASLHKIDLNQVITLFYKKSFKTFCHNADYLYLCTEFKFKLIMDKLLLNNFDEFRLWFNRNFKLSLNGKFKGLKALKNWQLFAYRLYKYLNGRFRFSRVAKSCVMSFCVGSDKVKLYSI